MDIFTGIDYNVLVRNKRENTENRIGAQVKDEEDHQTRADRDWNLKGSPTGFATPKRPPPPEQKGRRDEGPASEKKELTYQIACTGKRDHAQGRRNRYRIRFQWRPHL